MVHALDLSPVNFIGRLCIHEGSRQLFESIHERLYTNASEEGRRLLLGGFFLYYIPPETSRRTGTDDEPYAVRCGRVVEVGQGDGE